MGTKPAKRATPAELATLDEIDRIVDGEVGDPPPPPADDSDYPDDDDQPVLIYLLRREAAEVSVAAGPFDPSDGTLDMEAKLGAVIASDIQRVCRPALATAGVGLADRLREAEEIEYYQMSLLLDGELSTVSCEPELVEDIRTALMMGLFTPTTGRPS